MLNLILEYSKTYIRELMRNHSAAFFTLLFPAFLLMIFGDGNYQINYINSYIIYCNYAVQCVMLQALGITVASGRVNKWNEYLKTLPIGEFPRIAGRIIANLFFAAISLGCVIIVSYFVHHHMITIKQQIIIILSALVGGIPMALIAIWLGSLLNPAAARSVFVLLNILLLFSAFTLSSHSMWSAMQVIMLSYQWFLFTLSLLQHQNPIDHLSWMFTYTCLFLTLIYITKKYVRLH